MKRDALALVLGLALLSGCGKPETGPAAIRFGEDGCDHCRMIISEAPWAAQARWQHRVERFDDVGCLAQRLKSAPDPAPQELWVAESGSGAWIDARRAVFVQDPNLRTPMGWGLAAYRDESQARAAAAGNSPALLHFSDLAGLPAPQRER